MPTDSTIPEGVQVKHACKQRLSTMQNLNYHVCVDGYSIASPLMFDNLGELKCYRICPWATFAERRWTIIL